MKKERLNQIIGLLSLAVTIVIVLSPSLLHAKLKYVGVNLAGAEFGVWDDDVKLPGVYETDYIYPTSAEVDYYMSKGMNTFRLPFRWERLQRTLLADFDADELNRMDTFVDYATAKGAYVIIDPHNFHRYDPDPADHQKSEQGLIGSDVPDAAFADLWGRLAAHYKGNSRVIFGLMNEPNTMPTAQLVGSENAAIVAIREAGASNLILVSGNHWSGAWSWNEEEEGGANAEYMLNIVDSGNNFAFEVHQYMDDDYSGSSPDITGNNPMTGVNRLTDFTNWLKTYNRKGFLGEFAVANSRVGTGTEDVGDEVIDNMLSYMERNSDVWLGWTWWAGGPWWGEYMFTLEPTNLGLSSQGSDRPAMAVLQQHLRNSSLAPLLLLLL
ncbi:MAG: glycoside hydrolase family 5 protein [Candidatus Electrothrix sp. AUS4]|nr:glycoside hydrolase family 5 protein [Candidatus Electrothrix sp. AUS4]